jgi:ketosteroid isomerase-like protein
MLRKSVLSAAVVMLACSSYSELKISDTTESLIRSFDDRERIAALNRDVDALRELWSESFTVNAPNNRVVVGREANLQAFVRSGIINFATFDRSTEFIRIDGLFAIVMGMETVIPKSDAPSAGLVAGQRVQRRFTNIWRKEGDTWRLYWRHANVIPTR